MGFENRTTPTIDPGFEQLVTANGGVEYFESTFGLGLEELPQVVTFGSHTGTVAAMLLDEKCPVGGKIQEAYAQGGLEAVQQKLGQLTEFAPEFSIRVAPQTVAREQLKKI